MWLDAHENFTCDDPGMVARLNRHFTKQNVALVLLVFASASYVHLTFNDGPYYVDEVSYARLGYLLLHGHLASVSSLWPIYNKLGFTHDGPVTPYGSHDTVEPWLDSPPLVPLLLASLLLIGSSPRVLPIIFSSLTTMLIFFMLRNQRLLAWASALAWIGFFDSHQILSMLFLDSGVSFFNILTIAAISEYRRTRSIRQLYLGGAAAGASALSKVFGIASILFLIVYLAFAKLGPRKENLARNLGPVLLATGIFLTWPLYGLLTSATLFIQLQQFNASRSVLSGSNFPDPAIFVSTIRFTSSTIYGAGLDLAIIAGWIGLAYPVWKRKLSLVNLSLLCYLLVVIGLRYAFFYTAIPLFPFLAIGIGELATRAAYIGQRQLRIHGVSAGLLTLDR